MLVAVILPIVWSVVGKFIGIHKDLRELKRSDLEIKEKTARIRIATDEEIEKYDPKRQALEETLLEPPSDPRVRSPARDVPPLVLWLFAIALVLMICSG